MLIMTLQKCKNKPNRGIIRIVRICLVGICIGFVLCGSMFWIQFFTLQLTIPKKRHFYQYLMDWVWYIQITLRFNNNISLHWANVVTKMIYRSLIIKLFHCLIEFSNVSYSQMHYVILHGTIKINKKYWQSCLLSTLKHYIFGSIGHTKT